MDDDMPFSFRVDLLFGAGNRICPGKNFAKIRLFLLFAAILQRFDLQPDPNEPPPDIDPYKMKQALTTVIPKFKTRFVERN